MNRILRDCGGSAVRAKPAGLRERHGIGTPEVNREAPRVGTISAIMSGRGTAARGHGFVAAPAGTGFMRARRGTAGRDVRVPVPPAGAEPPQKIRTDLRGGLFGFGGGTSPAGLSPDDRRRSPGVPAP